MQQKQFFSLGHISIQGEAEALVERAIREQLSSEGFSLRNATNSIKAQRFCRPPYQNPQELQATVLPAEGYAATSECEPSPRSVAMRDQDSNVFDRVIEVQLPDADFRSMNVDDVFDLVRLTGYDSIILTDAGRENKKYVFVYTQQTMRRVEVREVQRREVKSREEMRIAGVAEGARVEIESPRIHGATQILSMLGYTPEHETMVYRQSRIRGKNDANRIVGTIISHPFQNTRPELLELTVQGDISIDDIAQSIGSPKRLAAQTRWEALSLREGYLRQA